MTTNTPYPAEMNNEQVEELLEAYPSVIKSLSKAAKNPDETLESLDIWFRTQLPKVVKARGNEPYLLKSEVQKIVAYKLKRGKFRPSLLGFASRLDEEAVKATTKRAFKLIESPTPSKEEIAAGAKELSTLKGIGPATASYLLAAYRPSVVPVFSDEAFRWVFYNPLAGAGEAWDRKIKYDLNEYTEFVDEVLHIAEYHKKNENEVEMIGFVLGRRALPEEKLKKDTKAKEEKKKDESEVPVPGHTGQEEKGTTKRKRTPDDGQERTPKKSTTKQTKRPKMEKGAPKDQSSSGRVTRSQAKQGN
ncbi:hypothetical protein BJ508DRAFT_372972 [Ascobolus immersus RN42]|uniref:Uncharacterized protein n=1 Tax=Ascobolus immersus RN42 TaxID=1160509 RepID=A0A3N4IJ86_ASCIM|nr:hypothetical protein BJ508DRAFT_372972 [Ascobolus immersus RN42]